MSVEALLVGVTAVIRPGHNNENVRRQAQGEWFPSCFVLVPFASGDSRDLRGSEEAWLLGLSCFRRHPAWGRNGWVECSGVVQGKTGTWISMRGVGDAVQAGERLASAGA